MSESSQTSNRLQSRLWRYALAAALAWTALIFATVGWNVFEHRRATLDDARHEAQISFQNQMLFLFWENGHGGGDAPATNNPPPSPGLSRARERALDRPASMLRQAQGHGQARSGYRSHLAGLNPLRPENAPDAWETRALMAFEKGEAEVSSVEMIAGQEYMRVMRPLVTEASCVTCHNAQDYKVGDIRGGMSVSVPLAPLRTHAQRHLASMVIGDGITWLLGLGVIGFGARRVQQDHLEQAKATEALCASEVRYRRLFESAKDGILILDAETGMIVDVNPFLVELLGFSREAFLGKKVWELGFLKDLFANQVNFTELQKKDYIRYEDMPMETSDGRRIEVEFVSNVYVVNHQKVIQCNIRDITDRKRAETALRESEQHYRSLFKNMLNGFAFCRMHFEEDRPQDFTYLEVNPAFETLTGLKDVEGRKVTEVIPGIREADPMLFETYGRVARTGVPERFELYVQALKMWFAIAVYSSKQDHFVAVFDVITERKRAEEERTRFEVQLRQQQKLESIGTLAGGVAHEINNPINGIMNYAQLIQDRLPSGSPLAEYTGEILNETKRIATIVRNLLTFARNEKQSHSPARMVDIVEGTLSLIRTVIRHDQITLTVNVPADLPDLRCRSQQIQQVLMNLMTNARDALNERYRGHDPDKVMNIEVRLVEEKGRRWIRVTVEDHGTGIPPEVRERIFDPFFTTKPREEGTGLGLAISHGIAKEHDGKLWFETEPGRWTRFHLDLPVDNGSNA